MKILVTGATGFIGTHLVQRLKDEGNTVFLIARPSTDTKHLKKQGNNYYVFNENIPELINFMEEQRFDGVIHLASLFLAQHTPEEVVGLVNSNVLFSTSILEAATRAKTPWFINTGTFWQHYQSRSYSPVNLYAATKQAFEDIARYYLETSPINFVTLKLSDTFGPGDTRQKIFNLWLKISRSGEELDMSPGEQLVDISFISNVIDAYYQLVVLLNKPEAGNLRGKSFAVMSGQPMSLKDLANVFERVAGSKLRINWGAKGYRPREVMVPWATGEAVPGWRPRVSLEEGIKLFLASIKD